MPAPQMKMYLSWYENVPRVTSPKYKYVPRSASLKYKYVPSVGSQP